MQHTYEIFSGNDLVIAEKILKRRYQMLVHSHIYYGLNKNIISDFQFDDWAKELVQLQEKYPDIAKQVEWAEAFDGWTGDTGAFLPYNDARIEQIARRLLNTKDTVMVKKEQPVIKKESIRKKLF